jgi:hypothetical protein
MALSRKERRYLAEERKAKGLPPLKPWGYRYMSLDTELAAKHGLPLEVVRNIVGQLMRVLTTQRSKTDGHCVTIDSSGDQPVTTSVGDQRRPYEVD